MVAYVCPIHVNMQQNYLNMQEKYVNMQNNYVNMQVKNLLRKPDFLWVTSLTCDTIMKTRDWQNMPPLIIHPHKFPFSWQYNFFETAIYKKYIYIFNILFNDQLPFEERVPPSPFLQM